MPRTRLTQPIREQLVRFAASAADEAFDRSEEDAAREDAENRVRALVESKFPPKDMRVLAKYYVARADHCIRLVNEGGGVFQFDFRDDADAPLTPARYCSSRGFVADADLVALCGRIGVLEDQRKREVREIVSVYRDVVNAARTAEDVKEAWPASAAILDPFIERKGNAVVVADPAKLARVKAMNLGATPA